MEQEYIPKMSSSWLESFYTFLFQKSQNEDLIAFPNLPLTGNLASILLVNLAYIGFVFRIGPWLMKNREPFNLKKVLMVYNAFQVLICSMLVIVGCYYLFFTDYYDLGCVLKLPPDDSQKYKEILLTYIGYLTKYLDYFDTIFFVLRKSYRQVTFLHVYHHLVMSFSVYCYIRDYGFSGHAFAGGLVNAFVHAAMYSYYFISANRPDMKKSIWWKRHLTELQIVQFVLALIHQLWPLLVRRECPFPKYWLVITSSQLIIFICLFGSFYKNTYLRKQCSRDDSEKAKFVKKAL